MNKNSGIQGLRAIAAFLVLLQHSIFFACVSKGVDYQSYLPIGFGSIGVGIFFVISGYVMTLCLPHGKVFLVQRVARVYPAYWIAVGLGAMLLPIIGRPWAVDIYSLSLLPASTFNESYGIPYWTLIYEMVFYTIIYLSILAGLSRKYLAYGLIIWALIIAAVCQSNVHPEFNTYIGNITAGEWIFFSPSNFMFIAGALYGLVGQEFFKKTSTLSLALHGAILFFVSHAAIVMPFYIRFLLWSISYLIVVDLVYRLRMPAFMERAGDFSYGLYLSHTIFIHTIMFLMVKFAPTASLIWYFLAALGAPLILGLAFGAVEFYFHARVIKKGIALFSQKSFFALRSNEST